MESADLYALMRPGRVCICRNVSQDEIESACQQGDSTFEQVQARTGCSTGCGTCESKVRTLIAEYTQNQTVTNR